MQKRCHNTSGDYIIGSGQTDKQRLAVSAFEDKKSSELSYGNLIKRHQEIAQSRLFGKMFNLSTFGIVIAKKEPMQIAVVFGLE